MNTTHADAEMIAPVDLPEIPFVPSQEEVERRIKGAPECDRSIAMRAWDPFHEAVVALNEFRAQHSQAKRLILRQESERRRRVQLLEDELLNKETYIKQSKDSDRTERERCLQQLALEGIDAIPQKGILSALQERKGYDAERHLEYLRIEEELHLPPTLPLQPELPKEVTDEDLPQIPEFQEAPIVELPVEPPELLAVTRARDDFEMGISSDTETPIFENLFLGFTALVFGASLALYTGFVQMNGLTAGKTASIILLFVFAMFGMGVLWATSQGLKKVMHSLSEWYHGVSSSKRFPVFPVAFLLILLVICLSESYVEGKAIYALNELYNVRARIIGAEQRHEAFIINWIIGGIICGPIFVYKALSGWLSVPSRIKEAKSLDSIWQRLKSGYDNEVARVRELNERAKEFARTDYEKKLEERSLLKTKLEEQRRREYEVQATNAQRSYAWQVERQKAALAEIRSKIHSLEKAAQDAEVQFRKSDALRKAAEYHDSLQKREKELPLLEDKVNEIRAKLIALASPSSISEDILSQLEELRAQIDGLVSRVERLLKGIPDEPALKF